MSVQNFIPKVWAANLLESKEKSLVFAKVCNREYEGEISGLGDSVKINTLGDITINDYVKDTDMVFQTLDSASQTLLINIQKSFSFSLDNIDKAQANAPLMQKAMARAAYKLNDALDTAIGLLYSNADSGNAITDSTLDSATIISVFSMAEQKMLEQNVDGKIWAVIPPWVRQKMVLAGIIRATDNSAMIKKGFMGEFMGFDIYVSNNVYTTGTAPAFTSKVMFGSYDAINLAEQIVDIDGGKKEKQMGDYMKGLHVYGMKVTIPKELGVITATYAAETAI